MKNIGAKKLQTTNKPATMVKKSMVQKSNIKKPTQTKPKKAKHSDANVSIKEKLSGKIFSPTVEKAKNVQKKKNVKNSVSNEKIKSSAGKQEILPAATKKKVEKQTKAKEEKTVQKKQKHPEHDTKSGKEVISGIKKKQKVITPKVENTDKVEVKDSPVQKRKIKYEKSKLITKKLKRDEVKVESGSSPVVLDVKKDDENIVARTRQAKGKRKSSVTSIKDIKPISNIKSLVKRPARKISGAKLENKARKFPERGVCYFSHIPHGFYEKELKKYCSQFGKVTRVYHPVSKSGNSRGYAFVEFQHKEVAEVVADTMNNYLMFNRLVKCEYLAPEFQRPWVFDQKRNNMKSAALRREQNLQQQTRNLSKEEVKKWKKRRQTRVKYLHKKLEKLGVDYEFQVNDTNGNAVQEEKKVEQ